MNAIFNQLKDKNLFIQDNSDTAIIIYVFCV